MLTRAGALAALLLFVAACGATPPDLGPLLRRVGLPVPRAAAGAPAPTQATDAQAAAIQQVVQRANEEQADAFAKNDPTIMRDSVTAAHYQEMVKINGDLASSGVTRIELVALKWGDVSVQGATATATTYETWRSTFTDGATEQSTDENDYSLVLEGGAWKIANVVQPGTQTVIPGQAPQPGQPAADLAPVRDTSNNWSGYVATGGTFTAVSATWVVPSPSGTTAGADATWIGIGGINGRDLIQAGTQSMASGGGDVRYEAWVETLPQSSRTVPLVVRPGDTVTVSLSETAADSWRVTIKNVTADDTYTTTIHYASSKSSAEWIEEAPSSAGRLIPLDDFGTLTFTDASTVKNGTSESIRDAGGTAVTMVNGARQPLAQPSTLGADGASFTITRTAASNTVTGPIRRRRP